MRSILKNTWTILIKNEKKQFIIHVLLSFLISIADILALAGLLWIIQLYIRPLSNSYHFLPGWLTDKDSVLPVSLFFLLFGVKNISGYFVTKAYYSFTAQVAVRISHNNLAKYQQTDFMNFVNTDSSSFIRKIALQPFEFSQHVLSGMQQIITQLLLIGFAIIAILIFNAKLFLLLLVILLPVVVAVFYIVKKRMAKAKKHLLRTNEKSYQFLLDALKGYVEANIYQRNDFFLRRFIQQRKEFSHHLFDSLSLQNLPARIIEIFAVLGLFILIAIAKWSGNDNSNTLITIGAFMAAAYKIIPGLVKVINLTGQIRGYEFSADELIQNDSFTQVVPENLSQKNIQAVEVKNISFQFAHEPAILNNFSFRVKSGDFLGISGLSGKGKTTVLNILLGFLKPVSGEVLINDVPVDQETIKQYWPSISYVRQQSFFIYDTILRNITLEEGDYDKERFNFAMKVSGLNKLVETFPEGLEKIITENGKNISGGQQQRIALARALYKNADLFLLDEPFNELDEGSATAILEHLEKLAATGKVIIMNTHDKQNLSFCNKIISLDEQG